MPTMKPLLSTLAFAVFVGITSMQCHYEGNARTALIMAGGVALWLSMYLFPGFAGKKP
jgi:hypothetical protein